MKDFALTFSQLSSAAMSFVICFLLTFISIDSFAQFQKYFGSNLNNSFSKVIPDGSEYYVLGQDQPMPGSIPSATITRLASDGSLLWTRRLDIGSQWNDAILIKPSADLLVVGHSLPLNNPVGRSIMGRIDASGNFAWVKEYDAPERDYFLKILEHPNPQNPAFPYYVLGGQKEIPGLSVTWDDVVLLNMNANGNFNWKRIYVSTDDDEFLRDMEALPNGNMILSGSRLNTLNDHSGIMYMTKNDGKIIAGKIANWMNYPDMVQEGIGGGFYTASNSEVGQAPFLSKFDQNLNQLWQVQIPKLISLSQVWVASPGIIYATGVGTFGSATRTVIMKFIDNSPNIPTLVWTKYFNSGSNYVGGATALLPGNNIVFADGRIITQGFGGHEAFLSISDLELSTCMVTQDNVTLTTTNLAPINYKFYNDSLVNPVVGVNLSSKFITWDDGDFCIDCCANSLTFSALINQGFTIVQSNCKFTATAPQFDSCYLFSTPPSLDGANAPQVITNPGGSWSYTFTASGTHQLCVNVVDECNSKKMCTTINVTCDTCLCGPFDLQYSIGRGPLTPYACGDTLLVPASTAILPIRFLSSLKCMGSKCPQPTVDLILTGPPGFIPISIPALQANPDFILPFTNASFSIAGLYTLTINGHCGSHICPCTVYFIAEGHDCCSNQFDFELGIVNAISLTVDNLKCKATINIGNLPKCDSIGPIFWGDGTSTAGNFSANSMPMHTYSGNGSYYISWTAKEFDYSVTPPVKCFEKLYRDSITLVCDTCKCNSFSPLTFLNPNWPGAVLAVNCGSPSVKLPCIKSGQYFSLQGNLNCNAINCIRDSIQWNIVQSNSGQLVSLGTAPINALQANASGHFDILLNTLWFNAGVQYILNVSGQCGSSKCTCKINFSFDDCPCPCDSIAQDVFQGFYISGNKLNCNRTVKPAALCPNDKVSWTITPFISPTPGISIGNNSQVIHFNNPGIYNVCMMVSRIDPITLDTCRTIYCRKVTVHCFPNPIPRLCATNALKNGDFSEGLVKGQLLKSDRNKNGKIDDWRLFPNSGNGLVLVDDSTGISDDGQVIMIGNKNNFAGIWQQIDLPIDNFINIGFNYIDYRRNSLLDHLLAYDIVVRLQNDSTLNASKRLELWRKKDPGKKDKERFERVDTSIRLQHDPDLKYLIICLQYQSGSEMSVVGIDNIELCSSKVPLSSNEEKIGKFRIYPNPNMGQFTVEMQQAFTKGMKFRILDLSGRIVLEQQTNVGSQIQNIDANLLTSGFYFIQLISDDKIMVIEKLLRG